MEPAIIGTRNYEEAKTTHSQEIMLEKEEIDGRAIINRMRLPVIKVNEINRLYTGQEKIAHYATW